MSDEEDLYDEFGVVEEKAVMCPSWRSEEVIDSLFFPREISIKIMFLTHNSASGQKILQQIK